MELFVRIPDGFEKRVTHDGVLHAAPDGRWAIFHTPLAAAQADPAGWMKRAAAFKAAPGVEVRVVVTSALTTEEGWPLSLIEVLVPPEKRIVAYLQVFDYCAGFVSRLVDATAEEEWRNLTMEIIAGVRVTFAEQEGRVACLADLLGGASPQAVQSTPVVD